MKNAIVLCSGGLDSVITANYVKKKLKQDSMTVLFFNYSQRSLKEERKCAWICAKELKAEFVELALPELGNISTSLINKPGKVQKLQRKYLRDTSKEGDKWYVPCRNVVFLSYALALAESLYVEKKFESEIFVGFKNEGIENFPDTSKEFVEEFNDMSKVACKKRFRIIAPLIKKDKEDIVQLGKKLKVNFTKTFSCYVGKGKHCGVCLACRLRQEGFYWANVSDPTAYKEKMKDFRRA